jgi:hypothetical protein
MNNLSVVLGGREFTLSSLSLGDLRKLEPALLGVERDAAGGLASMLSLVKVIHASISKLHPEITLEDLEQMLDLNNFSEMLDRVLQAFEASRFRS